MADTVLAQPTPYHLIVETVFTESLANTVMKGVERFGVTVATGNHLQIMRNVYTLVEDQDVYFKGQRLETMPGIWEYAQEWVTPGQQIVSQASGRFRVLLDYAGKRNYAEGKVLDHSLPAKHFYTTNFFGRDPAPERQLYGNESVRFVQEGSGKPFAAAYYDSNTRRFTLIPNPVRRNLLPQFLRRHQKAAA